MIVVGGGCFKVTREYTLLLTRSVVKVQAAIVHESFTDFLHVIINTFLYKM